MLRKQKTSSKNRFLSAKEIQIGSFGVARGYWNILSTAFVVRLQWKSKVDFYSLLSSNSMQIHVVRSTTWGDRRWSRLSHKQRTEMRLHRLIGTVWEDISSRFWSAARKSFSSTHQLTPQTATLWPNKTENLSKLLHKKQLLFTSTVQLELRLEMRARCSAPCMKFILVNKTSVGVRL